MMRVHGGKSHARQEGNPMLGMGDRETVAASVTMAVSGSLLPFCRPIEVAWSFGEGWGLLVFHVWFYLFSADRWSTSKLLKHAWKRREEFG